MPRPLLPAGSRRWALLLVGASAALTALLGVGYANHTRAGRLDRSVDARVGALLDQHPWTLRLLALSDPLPLAAAVVALALACLLARRYRAAALVTVATPGAVAITELVLKPLVHRTLAGALSFPSGHATAVFALAGALVIVIAGLPGAVLPRAARVLLAAGAVGTAGAVAAGVVGIHAHYATDTVGGAAVGTAVVLTTALLLDLPARGRAAPRGPGRRWPRRPCAPRS
jgi:membrane-associated phospholipid phosphatase